MVSVLTLSPIERGFEYRSDQTKDYKIRLYSLFTKYTALRSKSKYWLVCNQDNMCG